MLPAVPLCADEERRIVELIVAHREGPGGLRAPLRRARLVITSVADHSNMPVETSSRMPTVTLQ
jgi:hypothetical protein